MSARRASVDPAPASFLQLAGHRIRWRLLVELGSSDRTVRELTALTGQPQNLVSYHLGRLRSAGVVNARRSSADARDSYYRLDLARVAMQLDEVGAALHPAFGPGLAPLQPATPTRRTHRSRVLFVCTGNSGRSPMAEALLRVRSGGSVAVDSAGSHPKPLHPHAIRVLRERYDIDIDGRRPRRIESLGRKRFDRVITLCDRVRASRPELANDPISRHWSTPDPAVDTTGGGPGGYEAFEQVAADLDSRIGFLLHELTGPAACGSWSTGGNSREEH